MEDDCHQNDIPIWFNGSQSWMTGLTRRTTCDDIIYAMLYSCGLHEIESTDNFAIFEKWREVERPLSARTKILKVWSFWAEEQVNVQLSMRSLDDYFLPGESSLYLRSRRRHKRSSRHKSRHSVHCKDHYKRGCQECSRFRTLGQLVKLVVSQERRIQDLRDRISDTDRRIGKHESKIHQHRVQHNGLDYVQDSYLNSHSSESSSSNSSNLTNLDLKDLKTIFRDSSYQELEEIARQCEHLAHVERRIVQEEAKMQELTPEVDRLARQVGLAAQLEGETNEDLEEARVQMIRAVTAYVTNEYTERELDRKMHVCMGDLAAKAQMVRELQQELSELENCLRNEGVNEDDDIMGETTGHWYSSVKVKTGVHQVQSRTMGGNLSKPEQWPITSLEPDIANPEHYRPFERGRRSQSSDRGGTISPDPHRQSAAETHTLSSVTQHTGSQRWNQTSFPDSSSSAQGISTSKNCPWTRTRDRLQETHIANSLNSHKPSLRRHYDYDVNGQHEAVSHTRDVRSGRRSNVHHKIYNRSRSAERSTSAFRERSPRDVPYFNSSPKSNVCSENRSQRHCELAGNYTNSEVNQYGLELCSRSKGNETRVSRASLHSISSGTFQTENQLILQGVPTDSQYILQRQQSTGERSLDITYTDNNSYCAPKSNKQGGENNDPRNDVQTCTRDGRADLRTWVNIENNSSEKASIPTTKCNISADLRAHIRDAKLKDGGLFEQNISGPLKLRPYNTTCIPETTIHRDTDTSAHLDKLRQLSKTRFVASLIDSDHQQTRSRDTLGMSGTTMSKESEVYNNSRERQQTGHLVLASQLSLYNDPSPVQTSKHANDVCPSRQTPDVQIDSQTSKEQEKQDGLRSNVPDNQHTKLNTWSNTQDISNQSNEQGIQFSECSSRQKFLPKVQLDIYSPAFQDSVAKLQAIPEVRDRLWSDNDDVFINDGYCNDQFRSSKNNGMNPHCKTHHTSQEDENAKRKTSTTSTKTNATSTYIFNHQTCSTAVTAMPDDDFPDKTSNRGALYYIVLNKLNKSKSTKTNNFTNDDNHRSSNFTTNSRSQETPLLGREQYEHLHSGPSNGQSPNGLSNSDTFVSDSCPLIKSVRDPHTCDSNNLALQNQNNSAHTSGMSIQPDLDGYRRTANPHMYSAGTSSICKQMSPMHDKYSEKNHHVTRVEFQNCLNQSNKTGVHGILRKQQVSYSTCDSHHSNSLSIKDIAENRDSEREHDFLKNYSHTGSHVTQTTSGYVERMKIEDSNDSNSDTGLSSMHSDETTNMETLV